MNIPSSAQGADTLGATPDSAEARELADYLAGQNPLDAEAAVWAARQQDGLTAEEEAERQAWLAGDPARGARLDQLSGLWGQLDELPPDEIAALKAALPAAPTAMHPAVPEVQTDHSQRPPAGKRGRADVRQPDRRPWLLGWGRLLPQAALTGAAAMVVGGGWLGWQHWQQQPIFEQHFATARGQQIVATLPEGSTLRLDTATGLDVTLYRQGREVRLAQGRALFDVTPDPERPFRVLAGPLRITVLGTRFTVRHTQDGLTAGQVSVVVEEGHVRVAKARADSAGRVAGQSLAAIGEEYVELTAGQAVVADAQGRIATVTAASPGAALAWREGRVTLNDTPLVDAIAEFERYRDTGLTIRDPAVAALRLNGSFDLRQVPAFKRALPQVLPVRLAARPDGRTEIVPLN